MKINVKYFGLIAEITKSQEEEVIFSGHLISELLDVLHSKYPDLKNNSFKIALNKTLVSSETKISGTELALLPPFAGG